MRRDECFLCSLKYDKSKKYKKYYFVSLLSDCAYYCWQHDEITDDEFYLLESFLGKVKKVKGDF